MKVHPEMRQGETLIGNFTVHSFARVGLKTKRMGIQALDLNDKPINDTQHTQLYPVFAALEEIGDTAVVRMLERRDA